MCKSHGYCCGRRLHVSKCCQVVSSLLLGAEIYLRSTIAYGVLPDDYQLQNGASYLLLDINTW